MVYGRLTCCLAAVMLALSGCTPGTSPISELTAPSPIGPNDGSDSCHAQAQELYDTGNFFTADIAIGALTGGMAAGAGALLSGAGIQQTLEDVGIGVAAGGTAGAVKAEQDKQSNDAAVEANASTKLTAENQSIDTTQLAFNNDMDCRFQQAQSIKAAYAAGQITHDQAETQMAQVRDWAQRDIGVAQTISKNIDKRSVEINTQVQTLGVTAPPAPAALNKPAEARLEVTMLLRPDPGAPRIGKLQRHQAVTINASSDGYALVQTDDGQQGYVPLDDLSAPGSSRRIYVHHAEPAAGSQVQQLAGSNAARGDAYADSVAVSQSAVAGSGFQLAS